MEVATVSYNGSGTFQINTSGQPVVAGTVISSTAFNALTADLATGLSTAITKDGQTTTTARIPFAAGINSSLTTDSSSTTTGSIITAGGVGIVKNLYVGANTNIAGTLGVTGVATFSAAPIYSSLTASSAVATDASKALVSVTNTGTGNNVLATSPTLVTPVLGAASATSVTVAAGAVGTPSITTAGDTNTGIFFPAADTIAFAEGGAEAMRIDSSANVGIGTTTPQTRLHIFSSTSSTAVSIQGSLSAGTNTPTLDFTGDNGGSPLYSTGARIQAVRDVAVGGYALAFGTTTDNAAESSAPTERMRIDRTGNVIVNGTSTSSDESTYQGGGVFVSRRASSAGTTHANFLNGGSVVGSITSNTTTTFYNITSDYRLKENATPVTTGLQTIAALNPVNFNWVSNRIADTGFLAHEFQTVIPNSVMGTKDAIDASGNPVYQQIDRSGAIPFLVAAIKEQQALITAMTARIEALENK